MDTEKGSGIGFILESSTCALIVTLVGNNNNYNTSIIPFLSLFLCTTLKVTLTFQIISSQFFKLYSYLNHLI